MADTMANAATGKLEQTPFISGLRIPPQDMEAERALLGSIMLSPRALHDVIDLVSPDSFYAEKHRLIYAAIFELSSRGEPIDLVSLSGRLRDKKQLGQVGASSYLAELTVAVPTASNVGYYAELVLKKHLKRNLIEAAEHISALGYDGNDDMEVLMDKAEKRIFELGNIGSSSKFIGIKTTLADAWERLDTLNHQNTEVRGVTTGFPDLDHKLAGLQKSDLIILAARPSMGKTSLALDIARNAGKSGKSVGIFSLEMSAGQLVDRLLAMQSRVDAWKLRTGKLSSDEEFGLIRDALDNLSQSPIYIDDDSSNNIVRMRSVARRLKREQGLDLIIVDYLQLMNPTRYIESMVQQVTEISRALKGLARELDVPVLALSQLSRAVEARGGEPRLSDLRDSGCLTGDTRITRADTGERVPIRNLIGKKNVPVFALDSSYRIVKTHATKIFSSGRKTVYEIAMRSGKRIRASANHPFYTITGWKRLDELKQNTHIATPRALAPQETRKILSDDELILLAHLLGDGCTVPRQPIHYTSADIANIQIVEKAAKRLFSIQPRRVKQENWWHSYLPSPVRLTHGKHHPITTWFHGLGLDLYRAHEKRAPEALFTSPEQDIALFLRHLWATDGNISRTRQNRGRSSGAAIYYSSTSRELASDVQELLLRLGIWSTMRKKEQPGYRPIYIVAIQGRTVQLHFLETVGCFGDRGTIIPDLIENLRTTSANPNTDVLPKDIWPVFITPAREAVAMTTREFAASLDTAYNGTAITATGVSRERLSRIAEVLADKNLRHLSESDIYWDSVVSITEIGAEEVFDMEVPVYHNFVAENIVVHNSIEQDADVVLFIHRAKGREDDESVPSNVAKVIIAKHRNGPTGSVDLVFDDKHVTFMSVEKSDFANF